MPGGYFLKISVQPDNQPIFATVNLFKHTCLIQKLEVS